MIVSLIEAKAHLNVTSTADDTVITRLIAAAQPQIERDLGFEIEDEFPSDVPEPLKQAVLMLVAHWFENRETSVVGVTAQSLPLGVAEIVAGYRNYSWGEVADA